MMKIPIKKPANNLDRTYIITTVREDLEYLIKEWTQNINDDSLRITSVILRRLLVDNSLGQAWHLAGFTKQPMIRAYSLGYMLTNFGTHRVIFAQAGGAKSAGVEVQCPFQIKGIFTQAERSLLNKSPNIMEYSLSEFVESPCMVVHGSIIARRFIIKYVTNKLGGIHVDIKRNSAKTTNDQEEKAFNLLDTVYRTRGAANKNAIFYELLSIGQDLVNSKDIKMFIKKLNENYVH